MVNLGKFVLDTKIKIPFNIGDFTSWYTDKLDTPMPGITMRITVGGEAFDFLTYWLVGETDPYIVRSLDVTDMRTIDSSW